MLTNLTSVFNEALYDKDFLQDAILLLLTALITGILIPYIQERKLKTQLRLDNKSKLYDEISLTFLTLETLMLDVSYYKGGERVFSEEMHEAALKKYTDRIPDLLSQLRAQIVRAQNLASKDVGDKLKLLENGIINQDGELTILSLNKLASIAEWKKRHDDNHIMLDHVVNNLHKLAKNFDISIKDH